MPCSVCRALAFYHQFLVSRCGMVWSLSKTGGPGFKQTTQFLQRELSSASCVDCVDNHGSKIYMQAHQNTFRKAKHKILVHYSKDDWGITLQYRNLTVAFMVRLLILSMVIGLKIKPTRLHGSRTNVKEE